MGAAIGVVRRFLESMIDSNVSDAQLRAAMRAFLDSILSFLERQIRMHAHRLLQRTVNQIVASMLRFLPQLCQSASFFLRWMST